MASWQPRDSKFPLRKRAQHRHLCGLLALSASAFSGCKNPADTADMGDGGVMFPALRMERVATRAQVADQMRAAIEMQLSGEPLATIMGRNIANYSRYSPVPDQYEVTVPGSTMVMIKYETDPAGFSTAVESYEYSKMAMNHLSFEAGAGLSLMYGPRLNPSGQTGAAALGLLRNRVQTLALASRAGSTEALSPWVVVPAPTDNPLNPLGFPGLWPQFAEFRSYDPTIMASRDAQTRCTSTGANGGVRSVSGYGGNGQYVVSDYECSDNTLHLADRESQVEKVLAIDALGLTAWKQGLWIINYLQLVHDLAGRSMTHLDDTDLSQVGQPGNTVQARDDDPANPGAAGTYIGSTDLEGFQGLIMTEEVDNKAELLLKKLMTSDGSTLGGFASIKTALAYDYATPLRYFPHALAVTEQPGTAGAEAQPMSFTIQESDSHLADLTALLGAFGELFALTDLKNSDVGGSSTVRTVFDGDPFPADNGLPDGEQSPHDRALALIKVALINLDRLHFDASSGALVDSARLSGTTVSRSTHVTTIDAVHALVALRIAYRSLTSQLTLYSDATPDTRVSFSALDGTSLAGAPAGTTIAGRLAQLIDAQAQLLSTKLVGTDGLALNGIDVLSGAADATPTMLESQAAAIRGLLEAYLATSQTAYRTQAEQAYQVLEQRFYNPLFRVYRTITTDDSEFSFTPIRFGAVQSALREMYIQVGASPGNDALRTELEQRIGRLNKLVLNGWDDRNANDKVDYPTECLQQGPDLPRGGLQMGERSLTGELGWFVSVPVGEFDSDCVPNLSWVNLPAILAPEIKIVPAS